jgi:TRAP-type C4-dicarboxylate transport system permease small subunit
MIGFITQISRITSLVGGFMLAALITLTCLSIVGRMLNSFLHLELVQDITPNLANYLIEARIGPITGDYELLEAGMAGVIFAFMPLCQLRAGHAFVAIFTDKMPAKFRGVLICFIESVFALTLVLIAWQLGNGLGDKYRSHETTALLELPIWYGYAAALIMAYAAGFVAVCIAYFEVIALVSGQPNRLLKEEKKP